MVQVPITLLGISSQSLSIAHVLCILHTPAGVVFLTMDLIMSLAYLKPIRGSPSL